MKDQKNVKNDNKPNQSRDNKSGYDSKNQGLGRDNKTGQNIPDRNNQGGKGRSDKF